MVNISEFLLQRLECTEAYQLPSKLLAAMLDESRKNKLLEETLSLGVNLSLDFLRDAFQEEHGDRQRYKQDFTPDSVATIVTRNIKENDSVIDICAGTGTLSIAAYNRYKNIFLRCEELSERAISFLLFNLSIRNVRADVVQKDIISNTTKQAYRLVPGEKFSAISQINQVETEKTNGFDCVISNPPYSLKWNMKPDDRFAGFELPPSQFADFCFVLHGLAMLKTGGYASYVLPQGVLFRAKREAEIRKELIRRNWLTTVLGLPENLFLNTCIPVSILEFQKNRSDETKDILFVNASKLKEKSGKINVLLPDHVNRILDALVARKEIDKFAHVASYKELEENDFNLNIPRYADNREEEPPINFAKEVNELVQIEKKRIQTESELLEMIADLTGFSFNEMKAIEAWTQLINTQKSGLTKLRKSKDRLKEKSTQLGLF